MSKSSKVNFPKGLKTIVEQRPLGQGVKVTGANLGKISHLISLDAEKGRLRTSLEVSFARDGHLESIRIVQEGNQYVTGIDEVFPAGSYLVLTDKALFVATPEQFAASGCVAV